MKKLIRGEIETAEIARFGEEEILLGITPQTYSGLLPDVFPQISFNFLSFGIYPIILNHFTFTNFNLVIVYIPDKVLKHSQMSGGENLYKDVLWSIYGIFDDQWTFDSFRGFKSAPNLDYLNPIEQLDYVEWIIENINKRMIDLDAISDPFLRMQVGMTINRAIYDAVLCVTSEFPYMSKIFFLNCLDKLANIMIQLNMESKEEIAWKKLVDVEFLQSKVLKALEEIPDNAGNYLRWIINHTIEVMRIDNLQPDDLRDVRNSHHGYKLRSDIFKRLIKRTGEIDNDITLIVAPLICYFLSIKWEIEEC